MDHNEEQNLDSEYKRFLEVLRPYIGQLIDQDVIEIINAWIQRLSCCRENEKVLRNKYIFAMCYQLAQGMLEEPFLKNPSSNELVPLSDETNSDESVNEFKEVECLVLDLDNTNSKVLYNKQIFPITDKPSYDSEFENNKLHVESENPFNFNSNKNLELRNKNSSLCYHIHSNILPAYENKEFHNDKYDYRVKNLITKLRDIKKQNLMLHDELMALKEESKTRQECEKSRNNISKIDNATCAHIRIQDSITTLSSLKYKLQKVQESRNTLIETVSNLHDKLDNFDEMKRNEIEDLYAQHRLDIIQIKTSVREETKTNYYKNIEELKRHNEQVVKDIHTKNLEKINNLTAKMEIIISEKDKIIQSKDTEIIELNKDIEELNNNHSTMYNKFLNCPNDDFSSKYMKENAENLKRRLNKMEKSKIKYSKFYEAKLANLQREKHLVESAFHLQLVKQRLQIINETADGHQTELATALDKLESKYKDIVANVQATAVQCRIQDQMALESIIQSVCCVHNEGLHCNIAQATNTDQLLDKAMRNQTRNVDQSYDNELPNVTRDNRFGSVIVGNNSIGNESEVNGYCSEGEKFGELFERICTPQRDMSEISHKN